MGARPLKRAIDQYVLAPLAAIIVEQRFPEGEQFLFVRSDGKAIQAEFVDPESDVAGTEAPEAEPAALASMILAPVGSPAEFEALQAEYAGMERAISSDAWRELKATLAEEMSASEFWSQGDRFEVLARLAMMDRVKAATETAEALRARLARGARPPRSYSPELVARLALQLHLINEGIKDVLDGAPIEIALAVEPVLDRSSDRQTNIEWCHRLSSMYRAWAAKRRMQVSELVGSTHDPPPLLVGGFGAHRVLAREAGLHVFEAAEGAGRVKARVRLAAVPLGDVPAATAPKLIGKALDDSPRSSTIVRRYREKPPLVRNADGRWRTGRLDLVLGGDFDLLGAGQPAGGS